MKRSTAEDMTWIRTDELAELRKDRERLDALLSDPSLEVCDNDDQVAVTYFASWTRYDPVTRIYIQRTKNYLTPREAIDAAIEAAAKGGEG